MIDANDLRRLFNYDRSSGAITYAVNRGPRFAGDPAGSTQRSRPCIFFAGKHYRACLIAWILEYGYDPTPLFVVHVDGNPYNLAIDNLALSETQTVYRSPPGRRKKNPAWIKREIKFLAGRREWRLRCNGVTEFFSTRAEAIAARAAIIKKSTELSAF